MVWELCSRIALCFITNLITAQVDKVDNRWILLWVSIITILSSGTKELFICNKEEGTRSSIIYPCLFHEYHKFRLKYFWIWQSWLVEKRVTIPPMSRQIRHCGCSLVVNSASKTLPWRCNKIPNTGMLAFESSPSV